MASIFGESRRGTKTGEVLFKNPLSRRGFCDKMLMLQMKKFNFRFLFYPFLIFLLGLNVVRYIFNGEIEYIIICGVLIGLLVTYCIIRKHFKQMIVLLICFVVGCGWYFVGVSLSFNQQEYIGKVAIVGMVTDSISEEKYSYTIILDDVKINGESGDNISVRVTNCYDLPQVGVLYLLKARLKMCTLLLLAILIQVAIVVG